MIYAATLDLVADVKVEPSLDLCAGRIVNGNAGTRSTVNDANGTLITGPSLQTSVLGKLAFSASFTSCRSCDCLLPVRSGRLPIGSLLRLYGYQRLVALRR
jgi:hypothetical protein